MDTKGDWATYSQFSTLASGEEQMPVTRYLQYQLISGGNSDNNPDQNRSDFADALCD